jgi:DNA repair protein RadC
MKKISKKEKKLLKAAKKLEKATKKYLDKLSKIDKTFQEMPTRITRAYSLEERYFEHIPRIASSTVKLELLSAYLEAELNQEPYQEHSDWEDLKDFNESYPDEEIPY